jgi:hypothetical protein
VLQRRGQPLCARRRDRALLVVNVLSVTFGATGKTIVKPSSRLAYSIYPCGANPPGTRINSI